jgi:hypothetical protein
VRSAEEDRLLQIAESKPGDPAEMMAVMAERRSNPLLGGKRRYPIDLRPGQWWTDADEKVPFAVTSSAVDYYRAELRRLRAENDPKVRASLRYNASIKRMPLLHFEGEWFKDVCVVELFMGWEVVCGPLCGLSFMKERMVVLRPDGEVLRVYHDAEGKGARM